MITLRKSDNEATLTTAGSIRTTVFHLPTITIHSTWALDRCA